MNFGKVLGAVPMIGGALASAIPGIGPIAGPLLGAAGSALFNAAAVERERSWSEKMYNKYNSPQALVRQYEDAGLNPALMFGQSAIPAPTTSTAAQAPNNPFGDVVGMLGQLMEFELLDSQKNVNESQAAAANAAAERDIASAEGTRIENQYKPSLLEQQLSKGEVEIENLRMGIEESLHRIYNIDQQALSEEKRRELMSAQQTLSYAQAILAGKQGRYVDAQSFEKELDNFTQQETGSKPGTHIWGLIPGLVSRVTEEANQAKNWLMKKIHSSD